MKFLKLLCTTFVIVTIIALAMSPMSFAQSSWDRDYDNPFDKQDCEFFCDKKKPKEDKYQYITPQKNQNHGTGLYDKNRYNQKSIRDIQSDLITKTR